MTVKKQVESIAKRRSRRASTPLEVRLTLRYRFGDQAEDAVTMIDDRAMPMVGGVLNNRERILRALTATMVRAGLSQPKVLRELLPVLGLLLGRDDKKNK